MSFPPHSDSLPAGHRLGPYTLIRRLGSGGMATVYLASDPRGDRLAIKVMEPGHHLEEDLSRFRREFRAVASLSHPNVVKVIDKGETDGMPWLGMEYVDGVDLQQLLEQWRSDPPPDRFDIVERIFLGLCDGLQAIHAHGLIHRDLKPSNVLLTADLTPKISDFGVVKPTDATSTITMAGRLVGTIAYMAPELISGDPVDHRADLYGLGALLYTMLTLEKPIEADSVAGYLARHLTHRPTPPHELHADVPAQLERVCMRLLNKHPGRRYPTASAARFALGHEEAEPIELHGRDELLGHLARYLDQLRRGVSFTAGILGPPDSGRPRLLQRARAMAREQGLTVGHPTLQGDEVLWHTTEGPRTTPPDLVLLEDVSRIPPEVWDALDPVFTEPDHERPLGILFGSTPDHIPAELAFAETFLLQPLDAGHTTSLLRAQGLMGPVASVLGRRLSAYPNNWPGSVVEQLDALIDEGWLRQEGNRLRHTRPLTDFRDLPLPIPEAVRERLGDDIRHLDDIHLELLQFIALRDDPTTPALLGTASSRPARTPGALDALLGSQLITTRHTEEGVYLQFCHPGMGTLLKDRMAVSQRRDRHLALARALQGERRGRGAALEIAHHLQHAGELREALPLFLKAAKQATRARRHHIVLTATERARQIEPHLPRSVDPQTLRDMQQQRARMAGAALLAMGKWSDAVRELDQALALCSDTSSSRELEALHTALGRGHYRLGAFDAALPHLQAAIELAEPTSRNLGPAARAMADIHLQRGQLDEAGAWFRTALDAAIRRGSVEDEARARRGLAHVHGVRQQLDRALKELDRAEELLASSGDVQVRAGILTRLVELSLISGQFDTGLHRADVLLDLLRAQQMGERLPLGLAMSAQIRYQLGRRDEAREHARQALLYGRARPAHHWEGLFRATRVLCALDRPPKAVPALLEKASFPRRPLHAPKAQALALAARLSAPTDPAEARRLIAAFDEESQAYWSASAVNALFDVCEAWLLLGEPARARELLAKVPQMMDLTVARGIGLSHALLCYRADTAGSGDELDALIAQLADDMTPRARLAFLKGPVATARR